MLCQRSGSIVLIAAAIVAIIATLSPDAAHSGTSPANLMEKVDKLFPKKFADELVKDIGEAAKEARGKPGFETGRRPALSETFYRGLRTGRFQGVPKLMWNGFRNKSQRPVFRYFGTDFSYETSEGRRIKPGVMNTDGGTIPKWLHVIDEFSPWTYGPAFIIHDWLFVKAKCDADQDADISFEESALIMAEALKTLMEVGFKDHDGVEKTFARNEDVVYLMYLAVKSSYAQEIWEDKSSVECLEY